MDLIRTKVVSQPNGGNGETHARESLHAAFVDAWLGRTARELPPEAVLQLFEGALVALWARTKTTLGEVTLTAIADRVFYNTSERFPAFSSLKIEGAGVVVFGDLRARSSAVPAAELLDGVRYVLVELLTVLGNLTAELLTPELHAELANVTSAEAARREADSPSDPDHPDDTESRTS
jgi:hypothetical protein